MGATCGQAGHVALTCTSTDNDKPIARTARDRAVQEKVERLGKTGTARKRRTRPGVEDGVTRRPVALSDPQRPHVRERHGERPTDKQRRTMTTSGVQPGAGRANSVAGYWRRGRKGNSDIRRQIPRVAIGLRGSGPISALSNRMSNYCLEPVAAGDYRPHPMFQLPIS